ncbi:MAG: ATP-binding protein [Planctomycetaceae bacterium]|jgi:predicted ATP-dependent endonuclease of OLD family|nr:ATP-binding protein [Planctomycetaceae bacterium]
MILEIANIGKIQNAKIELRGITVVAGGNNTGKSTFGKVLYCMFNAFCNAETAIQKERINNLENTIQRYFHVVLNEKREKNIIDNLIKNSSSPEALRKILQEFIDKGIFRPRPFGNGINDSLDLLIEKIICNISVGDEDIQRMILTRFLYTEFLSQITHVNDSSEQGKISLNINNQKLEAIVNNEECLEYTDGARNLNSAFYFDTPFVVDETKKRERSYSSRHHRERLIKSWSKLENDGNIVEEVIAKQKLKTVLSCIRSVIDGDFKINENGLCFQENGLDKPLNFLNISAGMKLFLMLRRLLELGEIKEQDILVFDEPEIHLHPEWQMKFAETLVLLQKEFNLTILLTTHSIYFLDAIEVYSQKYGTSVCCRYYLAEDVGNACRVRDVTENTDAIYQELGEPFHQLEAMRYE